MAVRWTARGRVRGGALATVAVLATGLGAADAQAQAARPGIEILAPDRGTTHPGGGDLRVRVRVAPGVRMTEAIVTAGRDREVTDRFGATAGGVRTARLRLGRELRRGPAALRVRGRRGGAAVADTVHFWVADRRVDLATVSGLPRVARRAPLRVRIRARRSVDDLRVRVNGRDVTGVFTHTIGGRSSGTLAADEGLRFGRNRVVVTATTRSGSYERIARVVRIRRGSPLPGAGRDRLTKVRRTVRLDGRATLPRNAEDLRLTWRIVSRPRGSRAQLRNPHAVRPRLLPDRSGTYRVRLTAVSPRARRPARRRGDASAAQTTLGPATSASDVTTVSAQPATPPKGTPVQTIGSGGTPGITVGDDTYPMGGGAVQLVVLDGATGDYQSNQTFGGDDAGIGSLISTLDGIPEGDVVILSSPASERLSISAGTAASLAGTLRGLGVDTSDRSLGVFSNGVPAPGWSVVSSPGAALGTGRGLFGVAATAGGAVGAMSGYLQNAAGSGPGQPGTTYLFSWPSTYDTFTTQDVGSNATTNVTTVAGQRYASQPTPAGFHLVWLDAGTLAPLGEATIAAGQGTQLAQTLTSIDGLGRPAVLFLSTIGNPAIPRSPDGATNGWATVAQRIADFGGNPNAFLALDGSASAQYSLVGATGIGDEVPDAGLDVSTKLRGGSPQLVGLLDRRLTGVYAPSTGGAPDGPADAAALQPDIKQVLAQPDQPFPPFDGPGEAAAEAYVALVLDLDDDPVYGIRANYWNPAETAQWDRLAGAVADPDVVPPCRSADCAQGFDAVVRQLAVEFNAVAAVRAYFDDYDDGTLYAALQDEFSSGQWSFDNVNAYILHLYPPQQPEAHGDSPFDIVEGMLDLAAELAPEGGEVLGVAGAAIEIGAALAPSDDGGAYLGATQYDAAASQLASSIEGQYQSSLDGLTRVGDLLVSDWGRLQAAAAKVQGTGEWALDSSALANTLDRSIQAYLWSALLPTTFRAYQCVVPPVYYPPEDFRPAPWYPSSIKSDLLSYTPFTTVTHHPDPRRWGYESTTGSQIADGFVTIGRYFDGEHQYLDRGVAGDLFGPVSSSQPQQLGLLPAYFAAPQPTPSSPGFAVDQGAFDPRTDVSDPDYVQYSCAGNWWREDVNRRGW